ncbi:MAG: glutaredoxin family protein [Proteobacteria bacterium]|nr:glutaredoxin family protein [Pseudomonadota bacterium]
MTEFVLYSRSYCHLCDDMLAALRALGGEYPFTVEVVDVDADPALVALYDELVPVLVGMRQGAMEQLCHYFIDEVRVRAYLAAA